MKQNHVLNKGTLSEKIVKIFAAIVLNLWALSLLYPLFFGLNAALKESGREFMSNPVSLVFFNNPEWENFARAFEEIAYNNVSFFLFP